MTIDATFWVAISFLLFIGLLVYFKKAREKILKDVDKKRENLEKEINEEINKAEKEILDLKNKSPEKIRKIAAETSSDLIKQLIGVEVNNSSISAIVEDVSRKTN